MRPSAARSFVCVFIDGAKACYPIDQEQRNQHPNARKALLSRGILLDAISFNVLTSEPPRICFPQLLFYNFHHR
jgi:hypothetical protein